MQAGKYTALIFPTLGLRRRMMDRVSSLFGTPGVCLPWYMNIPVENADDASLSSYPVLRPLQEQKPPEDFPKLLREYRAWMNDHSDRAVLSFLSAVNRINDPEDSRWEIQKMVREGSRIDALEQEKTEALKWHLILHLATQLEREQAEAEEALRQSRAHGSPLKEALGEETDVPGIMGDLSPSFPQPVIENNLLEGICNAWLGLFGRLIERQTILVTFEKDIQQFLMARFREAAPRLNELQNLSPVCFDIGDPLFCSPPETSASKRSALLHRTLSVFTDLVAQLRENTGEFPGEFATLVSSVQELLPAMSGSVSIHIEMVSLPETKQLHSYRYKDILRGLSGKILAFLTENAKNG